jgi:hypothetical protein
MLLGEPKTADPLIKRAAREPAQAHERDWPPALPSSNLETCGRVRAGCSALGRIEWFSRLSTSLSQRSA